MNVTLTLDDQLVRRVRRLAAERDATLTGLVRRYLEQLIEEDSKSERVTRERAALDATFEEIQLPIGKRTWSRAELHERS